jgi:hypothetical protein
MAKRLRSNTESPDSPKKSREMRVIDALSALDPSAADARVTRGTAGIAPDFVLHCPDGAVGVEVVEYFRPDTVDGSPLREQEWLTNVVASRATQLCRDHGYKEMLGVVEFDFSRRIRRGDVSILAERLAQLAGAVGTGKQRSLDARGRGSLPAPIAKMWVHRRETVEAPYIGLQWGGTVPEVDKRHLLAEIRRKEQKLHIYRRSCSEVWLAVLIDPFRVATSAYVPPQMRLESSSFERVIAVQNWSYTTDLWSTVA